MRVLINDGWKMNYKDKTGLEADVPCSLYSVILANNHIEDPFYKDNEYKARELSSYDCEFTKTINIGQDILNNDCIELIFHGVDTIADLYINNSFVGNMNNMHRMWKFNVENFLKSGDNFVKIHIKSPVKYIEEANDKNPVLGLGTTMEGFTHIRKAGYMFGWDWGPQLPDMGILRDVEIEYYNYGNIDNVYVEQGHENNRVHLTVKTDVNKIGDSILEAEVNVIAPNGEKLSCTGKEHNGMINVSFDIDNPMLWWPHGYGEQNLYKVNVNLLSSNKVIDTREESIGLRTIKISKNKDQWGREFCFQVNGVKIFAMGADYIPEDSILPRCTKEKTEQLIRDCVKSNYNTIRVWGGGYYPDDYFYDLCDKYGLIVWQDFMFACAQYRLTDSYENNMKLEFIDVLKRIRNHACLGILCGNNEIESAICNWGIPENQRLREDYILLFERIIPEICEEYAPNIYYWPSSPSIGGGFNDPDSENEGDTHYWAVWHGNKPFKEFRNHYFRFCSEFGFESFPDMKTLKSFAEDEDMNPFSYVMESHQKCDNGNTKLMAYLGDTYLYPSNFENIIYASQMLQADAIRYGVEHFRRFRGRCMGSIYWQINDCWPGPSWASRDYFGRWKALQYAAKKFFAPTLLSVHDDGYNVVFNVSNERMDEFKGIVKLSIKDSSLNEIVSFAHSISIDKLSSKDVACIDTEKYVKGYERERFLSYSLYDENENLMSSSTMLFVEPKHFKFEKPDIDVSVKCEDDQYYIYVSADKYVKGLRIDFNDTDCILSDNYFDISSKETVKIKIEEIRRGQKDIDELKKNITLKSVYDIDKQ